VRYGSVSAPGPHSAIPLTAGSSPKDMLSRHVVNSEVDYSDQASTQVEELINQVTDRHFSAE